MYDIINNLLLHIILEAHCIDCHVVHMHMWSSSVASSHVSSIRRIKEHTQLLTVAGHARTENRGHFAYKQIVQVYWHCVHEQTDHIHRKMHAGLDGI